MKLQLIGVPVLIAGLLATANIALADQFLPDDGSGNPPCLRAAGRECEVIKTDDCIKYTIVQIKIGTETVISRQCSERQQKETYLYYPRG